MNEYLDSIYLELGNRSVVERSMMQGASYSFEDENILCLRLTDTIVAEGKKEALSSYLKDIFAERFQRPIEVRVLYEEAKDSKLKYNDMKLKQEVNAILDHAEAMQAEKGVSEKQEDKKESKAGKEKVSPGKEKRSFSSYGKGKRDNYSPIKRNSDDPNLVYGRDFDDDPIELRTVVGEMGEITLRGKIISFDTREIRNEKTIVMFAITDFTDTIMVKMFVRNEQLPEILGEVKSGAFLKIKGVTTIDKFDGELTIGSVTGIRKIADFTESRQHCTGEESRASLSYEDERYGWRIGGVCASCAGS